MIDDGSKPVLVITGRGLGLLFVNIEAEKKATKITFFSLNMLSSSLGHQ